MEKEYRAILAGNLTEVVSKDSSVTKSQIIEWITTSSTSSEVVSKRGRVNDPIDGFDALTELEILDVSPCPVYGALTTVLLYPHTGRRHQLRRHCAALGCPIVGDDLYHDAGSLPVGERQAAIAALSVGRVKAKGPCSDDDEDDNEEMSTLTTILTTGTNSGDTSSTSPSPRSATTEATDEADDTGSDYDSVADHSTAVRAAPEGVRRKVGIFLMCTGMQFYHPVNTVSGARAVELFQPLIPSISEVGGSEQVESQRSVSLIEIDPTQQQ